MHLTNYEIRVTESLMYLRTPNDFEIMEFLEGTQLAGILRINSIRRIRKTLSILISRNEVIECDTRSKKYPRRYYLGKYPPFCLVEPSVLKESDRSKIITFSKKVIKAQKSMLFKKHIQFLPDPLRDIVFAIQDNMLLGVVDLRRHHAPKDDIRFPTRFYKQVSPNRVCLGMSELKYVSILNKGKENVKKNDWISVNCWGGIR